MPSLSALLGFGAATLFSVASATKYAPADTYPGSSFFDHFDFVTEEKTNGFVKYVDRSRAEHQNYISYEDGDAIFGVDYKTTLDSATGKDVGRESVRLEGKVEYNKGLFVLDVKHMPGGVCGTWPAFWSLGREPWPVKGEIDIIEGVNRNTVNKFVLHTDTQCTVNGKGQTGTPVLFDCALDTNGASGCDVNDKRTNSYGTGFNANEGGHYVTEWQADGIKMWFFPRGTAPKSLTSSEPDTSEFGTPAASFQGDCDIEKRFMDQRFIFTNTFCGDWAGNVYAQSGCPMYDGLGSMDSCKKYVAEHPEVFKDAYWRVSSFKTYNKRTITSSSSVAPSSTSHVSSSSVHVSSSSTSSSSSSVHVSSSSTHASSLSVSSSTHASSSVAFTSSAASSSVSSTHISSTGYPSTTSDASSSASYDVSSSIEHSSTTVSSSASSTPYDTLSSSSSTVSETPYPSDISSSSSSLSASETPYPQDSSSTYPSSSASDVSSSADYSATSSPAHPDVTSSYPADDKSSSSSSVYPTSAPVYSVYPEGDGYGYGSVSSKTPDASSKSSDYPASSSKVPEYDSYPVASSSASVYSSGYPKSTPVYVDYPDLPSFTPLYSTYATVSSKPSYGDEYKSTDSHKTPTAYETTYVDVCPTGYTTITTKVTAIQTPAPYPTGDAHYAPPGFEVTTKYCASGCGEGPKTVTVTVPCSKCQAHTSVPNKPTDVPNKPTADKPYVPLQPSKSSTPEESTKHITATKIITLTTVPVPGKEYPATHSAAPSSKHPSSDSDFYKSHDDKPVAPTVSAPSKPVSPASSAGGNKPYPTAGHPVYPSSIAYHGSNVTFSYGTATGAHTKPSQTGYKIPEFTGAAARMRVGGVVAAAMGGFAVLMM